MKVAIAAALTLAGAALSSPVFAKDARTPILVELFTSEGCNDCPPANELLTSLSKSQPVPDAYIVALGEHVDYFNRPWVDPFSSSQFTTRQSAFAQVFKLSEIYTPQTVIDGRSECVGSDRDAISRAVARAAGQRHADVDVSTAPAGAGRVDVRVKVAGVTGAKPYLYVAVAEDDVTSRVKRGENAGRTLMHSGVVRSLVKVGAVGGHGEYSRTVSIPQSWRPGPLHAIAFVQDVDSGAILGTGMADL